MTPSNPRILFTFQLKQFSIVVSVVMTMNKSRGEYLKIVVIYLSKHVFSHGWLFVSHVNSHVELKVLICDDESHVSNKTYKILYKEIF